MNDSSLNEQILEETICRYILSSKCDKSKLEDNGFMSLTKSYLQRRNLWNKQIFLEVKIDKEDDVCRIDIIKPKVILPSELEIAYKVLIVALENLVMKNILEEIE